MISSRNLLIAGASLWLACCGANPGKPLPAVSGETSGTLSRLYLSPDETKVLEAGGREFFRKHAGDPPPAMGIPHGNFVATNFYVSDYRRLDEPRTMRGTTEDLAILPYTARVSSQAGGAIYRSYLLATRPRGGSLWIYDEGFPIEVPKLEKRFPGLKATNAVPAVRIDLANIRPGVKGR